MKYNTLSIIIPVYNEEKTIKEILTKVTNVKIPLKKEIICIDDGSTDNSSEIIKEFIKRYDNIKYFSKKNGGKGSAVRYGFSKSKGDIIIIQDADLEYNPEDYNKLLKPILKGKSKVVYGTRYHSEKGNLKNNQHLTYKIHFFGNKMLSLMTSILYFTKITDMETCYKMITRDILKKIKLTSNDFTIEPEITAKILKKGYKISEVNIDYYSRDFLEGKKITWKDGIKAAISLIKWRIIS